LKMPALVVFVFEFPVYLSQGWTHFIVRRSSRKLT
jgi:hypothetical protein